MTDESELPVTDRVALREMRELLRRRKQADSPRDRALVMLAEDRRLRLLASAREVFGMEEIPGMIPYAVEVGDIKPSDLELYRKVTRLVDRLPDGLTCHEVCERAMSRVHGLRWARGYFLHRGYGHSWLVPLGSEVIIDPYPWAGAAPLIVAVPPLSPWRRLYVEVYGDGERGSRAAG